MSIFGSRVGWTPVPIATAPAWDGRPATGLAPMPPMVPMIFGLAAPFERVGRCAPFAGGCLAREHVSGHAGAGELFELSSQVLAAVVLRVRRLPHVVMELANRDRLVAVAFPPDRE